jgi:flagellar motor switch protein FliG
MPPLSPTLRKAAVLISALDDRTADALLEQMGPEQAAKVRSALVALDDVPLAEQQAVLAEFLQQQGAPALTAASDGEVSLELHTEAAEPPAKAAASPLAFLREVAPQHLTRVLKTEQPQTVAVVIANLPAEQAADVLEQLPPSVATDALSRLAWLEELTPEIAADLARSLLVQLGPHAAPSDTFRESRAHHSAVVAALQVRQRQRLTEPTSLTGQSTVVAQRYRLDSAPQTTSATALVTFDELAQLEEESLRLVFAEAEPQLALLALTGADERLVSRILRTLTAKDAAALRRRLEHPGPIRLREIEQAREELAAIASRLIRAGEIAFPGSKHFAAAV